MIRMNNRKSLENLVHENLSSLKSIMSNGITILDNSIFGFPNHLDILKLVKRSSETIDLPILHFYNDYLTGLFEIINLGENVLTTPEIIDKEMFRLRKFLEVKHENSGRYLSKTKNNEKREKIKCVMAHIKDICTSLEYLGLMLSENELYKDFIAKDQFVREIFDKHKILINQLYNKFRSGKSGNTGYEKVCADDELVASSIILLKKLKKPIKIISNDTSIGTRLRVFNHFIYALRDKNKLFSNLYYLLNSVGIYTYDNLNDSRLYNLFGTTKHGRLKLHTKDRSFKCYSTSIKKIDELEKKYELLPENCKCAKMAANI